MPFGLDLKSIIVGVLIAYFLLPRVLAFTAGAPGNRTSAAV